MSGHLIEHVRSEFQQRTGVMPGIGVSILCDAIERWIYEVSSVPMPCAHEGCPCLAMKPSRFCEVHQ